MSLLDGLKLKEVHSTPLMSIRFHSTLCIAIIWTEIEVETILHLLSLLDVQHIGVHSTLVISIRWTEMDTESCSTVRGPREQVHASLQVHLLNCTEHSETSLFGSW